MRILLARTEGVPERLINAVNTELNRVGGTLEFTILPDTEVQAPKKDSFNDFFEIHRILRAENEILEQDHLCLLSEKANKLNWFSAFDGEGANYFIHTEGWDYLIDCPPEIPIAYQVLANFFQKSTYGSLEKVKEWAHEKTIGCINDMCISKTDVSLKIRTGDISKQSCMEALDNGMSEETLQQILEIMRNLREKSLLSRDFNETRYEDLPSTVAFTKRRLFIQSDPQKRFVCLLDHFDALLKTTVHLLGRILVPDRIESFLEYTQLDQRPSFGHWVNAIKKLAKENLSRATDLELPDHIDKYLLLVGKQADDGQITQIRNTEHAHTYLQEDTRYETAYDRCFPYVSKIEKLLSPILRNITLCQIGMTAAQTNGVTRVEYFEILGDHPTLFKKRKIEVFTNQISNPLFENLIYGKTPNGEFHNLDGSFKRANCQVCDNERLLIADGIYYFNNYEGHRFRRK